MIDRSKILNAWSKFNPSILNFNRSIENVDRSIEHVDQSMEMPGRSFENVVVLFKLSIHWKVRLIETISNQTIEDFQAVNQDVHAIESLN